MSLRRGVFVCVALLAALAIALYYGLKPDHPDALWRIVSQQCLPNQQAHDNPAPCAQVDVPAGFVVFKDRNGPLQYLLMPSAKITGIESPAVLDAATPNFFAGRARAPRDGGTLWQTDRRRRYFTGDQLGIWPHAKPAAYSYLLPVAGGKTAAGADRPRFYRAMATAARRPVGA